MSAQIQQKYNYSNIKSFSNQGDYDFYGIIYDATFPTQEDACTYICNMKIVDPEVNLLANSQDFNNQVINVVIKSTSVDALPFVHRIGDIIRVHRGVYKPKQKKNVYVNVGNLLKYKSAWVIFSGDADPESDDYNPIACSSPNYTFEKVDKEYINACRQWNRLYFRQLNSMLYPKEIKLITREHGSDCDALVKIIEKQELEDKIVYYVLDETDGCELHAYKYFNFFEINDVIRIRAVKLFESNRGVFVMNKFSNILKVSPNTDLYMEFMNTLATHINAMDLKANLPLFTREFNTNDFNLNENRTAGLKKNVIIEPVLNNNQKFPSKSIEEVVKEDTHVILTLNILDVLPRNVIDFTSALCPSTNESRLAKNFNDHEIINGEYYWETADELATNESCTLYYNLMFVATENPVSNKNIKLYLSSFDNEGESFMKLPATDFSRNAIAADEMKAFLERFQKHDNYVKVLAEVNNSGLGETDFIFRIVGQYKHN